MEISCTKIFIQDRDNLIEQAFMEITQKCFYMKIFITKIFLHINKANYDSSFLHLSHLQLAYTLGWPISPKQVLATIIACIFPSQY